MKLTGEDARYVVYGDHEDWREENEEEILDNTRWSIIKKQVFCHKPSKKFYKFVWSIGATECQDERAYEYDDFVEPEEVESVVVSIERWVKVDD